MNETELLNKACELSATATQIKTFCRLLSILEWSRKQEHKDSILRFEIETGFLAELRDNLFTMSEDIQTISNEICPD